MATGRWADGRNMEWMEQQRMRGHDKRRDDDENNPETMSPMSVGYPPSARPKLLSLGYVTRIGELFIKVMKACHEMLFLPI